MPSRLQVFQQRPWTGGLNTTDDPTEISSNTMSRANNIVLGPKLSRKSRNGLVLWDYIATSVSKGSSGTTRQIRITLNAGASLSNGDTISIRDASSSDANYEDDRAVITALDTATYNPDYLISYTGSNNLTESLSADTSLRIGLYSTEKVIGTYDYWYTSASVKTQKRIAVTSGGTFYQYTSDGSRTTITKDASVSLTTPLAAISFAVLNEKLIISFPGNTTDSPLMWAGGSSSILPMKNYDFAGNNVTASNGVPKFGALRVHQNRLFATDNTNPDRIHFSDINEPERVNGEGDSGAIDVAAGDGDKSGFVGLSPSFRGRIFAAKADKVYQIMGEAPLYKVDPLNSNIGCVAYDSIVAVGENDVLLASNRGFHSLAATDTYGDFTEAYISRPVQSDFQELTRSTLDKIKGIFIPDLNSVAWTVRSSGTSNNEIWLVRLSPNDQSEPYKWYKWTSDNSGFLLESTGIFENSGVKDLIIGTAETRLLKYDTTKTVDFVSDPIDMDIATGIIYPSGNSAIISGFKYMGIIYRTERSDVDFQVTFTIDAYSNQIANISQSPSGDLLGSSFTLGSSFLGNPVILLPEYFTIDGYGYGFKLRITSEEPIEIYGFLVAFEPAGDQIEVFRS
jgi:hypothetical protein